ncbi:MAG: uroporphyrinogen-III C-methyltransferase, partial [Terriglobia bacterium]
MPGKVYLVGAGPGDPGLITVRGRELIRRADCIIYDFLANEELLRGARESCERIFAGKRAGRHTLTQDRINGLMIRKAQSGQVVVRLKGGDPFIFGRGGEEAAALAEAGVPFEVVPGVSSAYAVPAYAGIPVTHRDLASGVVVGSAHPAPADAGESAAGDQTRVFLMGARSLPEIVRDLLAEGRDASTPAAVIRWGTTPQQEVVSGALGDIAEKARGLQPPAITVVGGVVRLREKLSWYEKLPLFG